MSSSLITDQALPAVRHVTLVGQHAHLCQAKLSLDCQTVVELLGDDPLCDLQQECRHKCMSTVHHCVEKTRVQQQIRCVVK